ncbi:MAG: hypothetical protein AAB654_07275 [Acidobacteriota bacterium]
MKVFDKLLGRTPAQKPEAPVRRRGQPPPVRPPALPETACPTLLNVDTVYAIERLHEAAVAELQAIRELLEDIRDK